MTIKLPVAFRQLVVESTSQKANSHIAHLWLQSARMQIQQKGLFQTGLSGGITPFGIYQQIVHLAPEYSIDWTKIFVYWTDERCVPLDHPESNYNMAQKSGILDLPIPKSQIFPMSFGIEVNPEQDGMRYDKLIKQKLGTGSLDFILLGLGEDGHTASLFTGSNGFEKLPKLTGKRQGAHVPMALAHFVESKRSWRMTMSLNFINRSKIKVGCATGETKSKILASVLKDDKKPYQYPASWLGCENSPIVWVTDTATAKEI